MTRNVSPIETLIESAYRVERRRIRRLIAKHLLVLKSGHFAAPPPCVCVYCEAIRAIDAATRAPKKARAK